MREPKLLVFVVLAVVHVVGVGRGFRVWYFLRRPGFDPMVQLHWCGVVDVGIGVVAYVLYFRRSWRLTAAAVVVAFVFGVMTGLAAVVWHVWESGWR